MSVHGLVHGLVLIPFKFLESAVNPDEDYRAGAAYRAGRALALPLFPAR